MRETFHVLLVEDEPFWRQAIADIIGRHARYHIVGLCCNLAEAMQNIRTVAFDLMIIDLGLPDGSGIEAIREARRHCPGADILVGTVFADESSVVAAICAGATGYLVKDTADSQWVTAIDDLRAGRSPISPQIARHILRAMQVTPRLPRLKSDPNALSAKAATVIQPKLTVREIEVLNLVAKGFTLNEVGKILNVSVETARSHTKNIYRKLEVNSRGEAVYEAALIGIL